MNTESDPSNLESNDDVDNSSSSSTKKSYKKNISPMTIM